MEPRIQYAKTKDEVNVAYAVFGSGSAIVFPGSIWGNLHLFKNEAFDLGAAPPSYSEISSLGWSVITYDGRGTGSSDRHTDDWTLNGRLRDLEAVVERAAPARFALCGQIHGGSAAVAYAVQHPDRVSRQYLTSLPVFGCLMNTRPAFDRWNWGFCAVRHRFGASASRPQPRGFTIRARE